MPMHRTSLVLSRIVILTCVLTVAQSLLGTDQALHGQSTAAPPSPPRNVILVSIDGLRWQEVFRGAEERLLSESEGDVRDVDATRLAYWRESAEERRSLLMPFFWQEVIQHGQVFGNRDRNSKARLLNDQHFSYPGYSELLCGYPDERISSNDKIPNPNITVLEWLSRRPAIGRRVAAFCSWDVFPFIINVERCGLTVNAGWMPLPRAATSETLGVANELLEHMPRLWRGVRYDAFTAWGAKEYLKQERPRLLYVSLGEPDDWAHAGRYDLYLDSTRTCDRIIRELWELAQSLPEYRGNTTLVLAVDHGRGNVADQWKSHSATIPGSDEVWMAVMGPDTPAMGERLEIEVTQSQVAATVAALLGEDYVTIVPQAGQPLPGVQTSRP